MSKTKKLWVVVRTRHTTEHESTIICGLYENFGDAVERVKEVFDDDLDTFEEVYEGAEYEADNHNNGYAELHYGESYQGCYGYDDIIIQAQEYEINQPIFDEL